MASDDPIRTAQTIILCQFCDESTEIRWHCIDCELLLCQLCNRRIHSKSKSSMEHQVVNLIDCGTEDANENFRKTDLRKMECAIHHDQKCVLFCNNCEIPICLQCMLKTHKTHDLIEIEDAYVKKLNEVKDSKNWLKRDILILQNDKKRRENILVKGDEALADKSRKIKQSEEEVHQAVRDYSQSLQQKLEKEWEEKSKTIKMADVEIQNKLEKVVETLESRKAWDIFNETSSPYKVSLEELIRDTKGECSNFVVGKIRKEGIIKMIGHICLRNEPEFAILQTYSFKQNDASCFDLIFKILSCGKDSVFIASKKILEEKIMLRKLTFCRGEMLQVNFDTGLNDEAMDMDILPNGDVILTTGEEVVNKFTIHRKFVRIHTFSSHKTRGVHVKKNHKILLGLLDCTKNHGKILLMTLDFKVEQTYEYDKAGTSIFSLPVKVQSTSNDNICVVDRLDTNLKGRLVTLGKDGIVQWIYNGSDQINSKTDVFTPTDIAITKTDFILISDFNNHAIHILDDKGYVICWKSLLDFQITFPISVDADKEGKLWIVSFCKMNSVTIHHVGLE